MEKVIGVSSEHPSATSTVIKGQTLTASGGRGQVNAPDEVLERGWSSFLVNSMLLCSKGATYPLLLLLPWKYDKLLQIVEAILFSHAPHLQYTTCESLATPIELTKTTIRQKSPTPSPEQPCPLSHCYKT